MLTITLGLLKKEQQMCRTRGGFRGVWDQSRERHLLRGQAEKKRRCGGEVREALVDLIQCRVAGCSVAQLAVTVDPGALYEPKRHRRTSRGPWLPIEAMHSVPQRSPGWSSVQTGEPPP